MQARFAPVEARQTQTRSACPLYARHIVRLRLRFEAVDLHQAVPEIISQQPRRFECIPDTVVDDVVAHALALSERFDTLAGSAHGEAAPGRTRAASLCGAGFGLAVPGPGQAGMAVPVAFDATASDA